MSTNNLYSLLSNPWMIKPQALNALMPVLYNIQKKGGSIIDQKQPISARLFSSTGTVRSSQDISIENIDEGSLIAVLPIKGTIMKYSSWWGYGTREYREIMESWKDNDTVAGIILDIDSGGGSVAGTPEFADYILNYPKPVVTYTDGDLCSAAYYIAAGSDYIIANPYADTIGSTGTMLKMIVIDGMYEMAGAKIIEEYSSKSNNKNGAIRQALDKENPSNNKLIEEILDPVNDRFLDFVTANRPGIDPEVLTGQEYATVEIALQKGLIDSIGTMQDAVDIIFILSEKNKEINNNNNNMSENKKYPKIAAVLGMSEVTAKGGFLFGQKSVNLSEEQLDILEENLSTDQSSAIAELQQREAGALKEAKEVRVERGVLEATVKKALEASKLETTGTTEGDINLLSSKVMEYGGKPGANPTNVHSKGDIPDVGSSSEDELGQTSIMDNYLK